MTGLVLSVLHLMRFCARRWGVYALMVAGLGLSYCAAVIIGLYTARELSYDRFIPGGDQVYMISSHFGLKDRSLVASDVGPAGLARWMRSDLPELKGAARLNPVERPMRTDRRSVKQAFYWTDPNFFEVVPLPVAYGNLKGALSAPDNVVLTERMALAYFGTRNAVGQTLLVDNYLALKVTAVLKDFPASTHFDREIFASGLSENTLLHIVDASPRRLWPTVYTYATFKAGFSRSGVERALSDLTNRYWQGPNNIPVGYRLIALPEIHFSPPGDGQMKSRGHINSILLLVAVAAVIVALAAINFSGLVLAETTERTAEMAVRRAVGARRSDLVSQIIREALAVNLASALAALALAERILPDLNRQLSLDLVLWSQPALMILILSLLAALVSVLSALYPALVVSRSAMAWQGAIAAKAGRKTAGRWRGWIIAQLSLVIVLLIASHTVHRQWSYAVSRSSGIDGDHVLMVRYIDNTAVNEAFGRYVRTTPGVVSAAESFGAPTNEFVRPALAIRLDGRQIVFMRRSVHPDFFRVYGIPLIAGRNLSGTFLEPEVPREILISRSAASALGFASPGEAVGRDLIYDTDRTRMTSRIVGVVEDIRIAPIYEANEPMIFDNFSKFFTQLNLRLEPGTEAQTLRRLDKLWREDSKAGVAMEAQFFPRYIQHQYRDLHQQMDVFLMVSGASICLSVLGLFGLSIFLTRHQQREIAIRRALGATELDIFRERLTPFLAPFGLATLIGWGLAFAAMTAWLGTFKDGIALSPVSFLGASAGVFGVGLLTLAAHALMTRAGLSVRSLSRE